MNSVQQFRDADTLRQQRNLTKTQRRSKSDTIEGVVVNNLAKQQPESNINELYDSLIISKNLTYPDRLVIKPQEENSNSALKKLSYLTVGLFGLIGAATYTLSVAARKKAALPHWKTLPEVPRNIALNEETHFATYAMIQNPNTKTIIGAIGVFLLTAAGAIGKNFVDGYRDIWVKKKEAKVQRDLQESLIDVETQTFSGKMQIQRAMLSKTAKMFENYLSPEGCETCSKPAFKNFIAFSGKSSENSTAREKEKQNHNMLIGAIITLAMGGLTYFSMKNLQKTAKHYENFESKMQEKIKELIKNSNTTDESTLKLIKNMMVSLSPKKSFIEEALSGIKLEKEAQKKYLDEVTREVEKITQEGSEAIAGKPGHKASLYSHVDDIRGHFYNWIVNFDNSILGWLFGGLTAVTAIGYAGKQALDGIKQTEVIKANAETELNLQKNLVRVELKNFYAKKTSVIKPLINEFISQANKGKDKCELKTMAENILLEIKNGPPFVYS